jgi:dTDP-4-dehydrorhamnose reductase
MLGTDVVLAAGQAGAHVRGLGSAEVDITDGPAVAAALADAPVDVVVNCAAYTRVDDAETDEDTALSVNGDGAGNVAAACAAAGARLLHISTDYVFGGDATSPYPEDARPAPRSAYGRTKLAGELAVLRELPEHSWVVRTAWLYGAAGRSFVRTMMELERSRETLDVVDDQRGQPTWTADLARQLVALVAAEAPPGTYHGTSSGETTWFGLAQAVFAAVGADPARVRPTTTDRFPRPAPRPAYSVLGHDRWAAAGLQPLRPWQEALAEAVPALSAAGYPSARSEP